MAEAEKLQPDEYPELFRTIIESIREGWGQLDPDQQMPALVLATRREDAEEDGLDAFIKFKVSHLMGSVAGKNKVEKLMLACALSGATMVAFVSEAWVVVGKQENEEREKISEGLCGHPDRVEAIAVSYHERERTIMAIAEIERFESGARRLEPFEVSAAPRGSGSMDGRFANIFQKAAMVETIRRN